MYILCFTNRVYALQALTINNGNNNFNFLCFQVDISDSHQSIAPETVPPRSENVIKDGKMVCLNLLKFFFSLFACERYFNMFNWKNTFVELSLIDNFKIMQK